MFKLSKHKSICTFKKSRKNVGGSTKHYPKHIHTVMRGGGRRVQVAKASTTTNWFQNTFLPYLTNECVHGSQHPEEIVAHMQAFWNTQYAHQPLTKKVAQRMLKEFVTENTQNTNYALYQYHTPMNWSSQTKTLVGGGAKQPACSSHTNYAAYNYDNYNRWRGNLGASVPVGASIPQNPFQRIYNWFNGRTTILNPGNNNPTVQNQVQY